MLFLCHIHDLLDLILIPNITGIDAHLIDAQLHHTEGQPIVKMDIRHQGDMDAFFDLTNGLRRRHIRNGHAHQFTARFFQGQNLRHGGIHISRICITHRLNDDWVCPAHHQITDFYFSCPFSFHFSTLFRNLKKRLNANGIRRFSIRV